MAGQRVLIIDDNQIFGSQVVAAFTDVGLPATWVARGSQALSLLDSEPVQLLIVDLVRPASGGRQLLEHLAAQASAAAGRGRQPLALALVPVIGSFHDLPEGIEVQVKPIFPTQVVASARRLLGLAPASSPSTGGPRLTPMSGSFPPVPAAPTSGSIAQHRLPQSLPPGGTAAPADSELPTGAHGQVGGDTLDEFEDSSDFGPADTLLVPLNIEELARAMTHSAPTGDDLLDSALIDSGELELAGNSSDETGQLVPVRSRTRPQFMALKRPPELDSADSNPAMNLDAGLGPKHAEEGAHLIGTQPVLTSPSAEALASRALLSQETNQLPRALQPFAPASGRGTPLSTPIAAEAMHLAAAATAASPALTGDLAVVPLIDVVSLLARQRQSGVLRVFAEVASQPQQLTWTMAWTQGRLDQITATGVSEPGPGSGPVEDLRIGRFVLEAAALSHTQVEEIEARRQNQRAQRHRSTSVATPADTENDLLGVRLVKEGLLQLGELRQALSRQTTELFYFALRMAVGRFVFDNRELPPSQAIDPDLGGRLGLDTETLLLEGYRRVHDYHMLAKDVEEGAVYVSTTPTTLLGVAEKLSQLGLSEVELTVLAKCNGRLSLGEIARESHIPLLDVARTVQRLQALRLCRRRLPALLAS